MSLATLLDRNKEFAATDAVAKNPKIPWLPNQPSYVITRIDSRAEPAGSLGVGLGDATMQRVVGGRVTPAVLRDVAYISYLTETKTPGGPRWELAVIHHTDCGSTLLADPELRRGFAARGGYVEAELAWLPASPNRKESSPMPNESKASSVASTVASEVHAESPTSLPVDAPESVGLSTERLNRLDDAMQSEIDAGHYAGISVMVARHGRLVKSRRYGYQVLGDSEPLREDAIFRIASMTKPVVAVAMLRLYEEGKWHLDDPVTKFIPEFADLQVLQGGLVPLERPMTMRHLMASSAGFAGLGTDPQVLAKYAAAGLFGGTNDEIIPKLAKLPLASQPGTEFRYGLQQEVQGAILRRLTDEKLDTVLERLVLKPLGMKDAGFEVAPDHRDRIPPRYALDDDLKLVLAADQSARGRDTG